MVEDRARATSRLGFRPIQDAVLTLSQCFRGRQRGALSPLRAGKTGKRDLECRRGGAADVQAREPCDRLGSCGKGTVEQRAAKLFDEAKIAAALSNPMDAVRQTIWTKTQAVLPFRGPLALFKRQTDVIPLLDAATVEAFGLATDPVVDHKRKQQKIGQPYPADLFEYVMSKAPQVIGLS